MSSNLPPKSRSTSNHGAVNTTSLRSAFTLIELLVVVAIIAILSAIAVPNFLEAQTRSKVSRTKADLRSVASALETYRTDYNMYPFVSGMSVPYWSRLRPVTTPIAYIQTLPTDIFSLEEEVADKGREFVYAPGNLYNGGVNPAFKVHQYRATIYSVSSRGPDKDISAGGYCMAHPLAAQGNMLRYTGVYDPTNGTISPGDIIQLSCGRL